MDEWLDAELLLAIERGELRTFLRFCGLPPVHHWQTSVRPPEGHTFNRLLALLQCTRTSPQIQALFDQNLKDLLTSHDFGWHWMEAGRIEGLKSVSDAANCAPFFAYISDKHENHFRLLEAYLMLTQQQPSPVGQHLRALALYAAAGAQLVSACAAHAFQVNNRWNTAYVKCFPWLHPTSGWTHRERVGALYAQGEILLEKALVLADNTQSPALAELLLKWLHAKSERPPWRSDM